MCSDKNACKSHGFAHGCNFRYDRYVTFHTTRFDRSARKCDTKSRAQFAQEFVRGITCRYCDELCAMRVMRPVKKRANCDRLSRACDMQLASSLNT